MRVLLVSNYEADGQYSMLGFAECLERRLPEFGCEVERISARCRWGRLGSGKVRKWLAYADKYILFPRTLKNHLSNCDVVHILDQGNAMYVSLLGAKPHVVTCHDLLAARAARGELPYWTVGPTGKRYQAWILASLKKVGSIVAASEATRADVLRLTRADPSTVRTVYNGLYQNLQCLSHAQVDEVIRAEGLTRSYLLHVGGDSPYKNRSGLIDIYRHLADRMGDDVPDLVLAGRAPDRRLRDQLHVLPQLRVHTVQSPDPRTLAALYQGAAALIFPSLAEGFGLPILEAQTLGCPVFTTNQTPMTEVGGEGAVYFDPQDPGAAAKRIQDGLQDAGAMTVAGHKNSQRFCTAKMVAGYVKAYEDALG